MTFSQFAALGPWGGAGTPPQPPLPAAAGGFSGGWRSVLAPPVYPPPPPPPPSAKRRKGGGGFGANQRPLSTATAAADATVENITIVFAPFLPGNELGSNVLPTRHGVRASDVATRAASGNAASKVIQVPKGINLGVLFPAMISAVWKFVAAAPVDAAKVEAVEGPLNGEGAADGPLPSAASLLGLDVVRVRGETENARRASLATAIEHYEPCFFIVRDEYIQLHAHAIDTIARLGGRAGHNNAVRTLVVVACLAPCSPQASTPFFFDAATPAVLRAVRAEAPRSAKGAAAAAVRAVKASTSVKL